MWKLLNAGTGLALAAWLSGTGSFPLLSDPRWDVVRADLAAAAPADQFALQAQKMLSAGMPRPAGIVIQED